jgi:hypothetical protein
VAKPSAIIFRFGGFVPRRTETSAGAANYGFRMSTANHDEVPPTNFDTPGRAKKLKAVCLQAGFAIVVIIAMAGWLYFIARLVLSFATWLLD